MDNYFQIRKSKDAHAFFWVEFNYGGQIIRQDPVTHRKLQSALDSAYENGAQGEVIYVGREYEEY